MLLGDAHIDFMKKMIKYINIWIIFINIKKAFRINIKYKIVHLYVLNYLFFCENITAYTFMYIYKPKRPRKYLFAN